MNRFSNWIAADFWQTAAICILAALATAGSLWLGNGAAELSGLVVADFEQIAAGELWRVVTGPLVHANAGHLVRDLAILAIVGFAYEGPLRRSWPWLIALGMAIPTVTTMLVYSDLVVYYGTSGLTHALITAAIAFEFVHARERGRKAPWYVYLAAVALGAKLVYETATGTPLFAMDLGHDVRQVPAAHLAGALCGALVIVPRRRRMRGSWLRFLGNPSGMGRAVTSYQRITGRHKPANCAH